MKQTQNQFFGKLENLPSRMEKGSQYISVDTNEVYVFGEDGSPQLISVDKNSDVQPQNVTISEMNNLTPKLGEIVFETDTNVNRYWNGVEWKLFPEGSTPIDDVLDNRIIVNQLNVATTLGGVIDSTKEYFLDGIIDMGTTQITVPVTGMTIRGYSFDLSGLTSSEDNYTMFVSASVGGDGNGSGNLLGADYFISVTGAGSKVYELYDDTGFNAFEFSRINYINCSSLGDLYNYRQGLESGTGRFSGSPSLTLHGLWRGGYRITTSIVRSLSGLMTAPLFKEGTAFQMNSRFLTDINVDLPTLAPFCDFTAAAFPNPSTVQIKGAIISRDGAFNANDTNIFPNLTASDLPCDWDNNIGITNTFVGGSINNTAEVQTNIVTQGVPVDLAGTWTADGLEHFDSPTNGRLRHLGINPREYQVTWDFVIEGKNNDNYEISLVKFSGATPTVEATQTRVVNNLQGGRDVGYWSGQANIILNQNDFVFWQVANLLDSDNCTLEVDSSWSVKER